MDSRPDTLIRGATAFVVVAVAVFAAVVSYTHIFHLGYTHGQQGTAGRLLPLSVDGLIIAASLVLLHEARNARPAPPLARVMLWLGIAATVSANVAYGAAYGITGSVISAWPAVAFIGSAELAMGLVRRSRLRATPRPQFQEPAPNSIGKPQLPISDVVPRQSTTPDLPRRTDAPPLPATTAGEPPAPADGLSQIPPTRVATPRSRASTSRRRTAQRPGPATPDRAAAVFAAELAAGNAPSLRAVRREMHVGTDRARELRNYLIRTAKI